MIWFQLGMLGDATLVGNSRTPDSHGDGSTPVTLDVTVTDAAGNPVTAFATITVGINPAGVIVG